MDEGAQESVRRIEERAASLPELVRALVAQPPELPAFAPGERVVVTGIGASAGPARYLAALLTTFVGAHASFAPVSSFVAEEPMVADTLVVFSQYLSPNGRIPLRHAHAFGRVILVTSSPGPHTTFGRSVQALTVPPEQESGTLVRFVGPSLALVVSALCASASARIPFPDTATIASMFDRAPTALAAALAGRDAPVDVPFAIVTGGSLGEVYRMVRWKLLEGWLASEPPGWDVLEFAHGPFQSIVGRAFTLLSLESASPTQTDLFDRLDRMLQPDRHTHVRLRASSAGPLAVIEHDALTTALLLEGLRQRPRDLFRWEGASLDAPIYDLDR